MVTILRGKRKNRFALGASCFSAGPGFLVLVMACDFQAVLALVGVGQRC